MPKDNTPPVVEEKVPAPIVRSVFNLYLDGAICRCCGAFNRLDATECQRCGMTHEVTTFVRKIDK